jgi:hypothetical protein
MKGDAGYEPNWEDDPRVWFGGLKLPDVPGNVAS